MEEMGIEVGGGRGIAGFWLGCGWVVAGSVAKAAVPAAVQSGREIATALRQVLAVTISDL
jgi:hypothetical protein